jgi:two-component system, sensor histidine kinase and response regulator
MARILVIDDDNLLRDGIAEVLELNGYEILKAEHGAMGIQMAQDTLPDLIVCDVMMPGLNGYDVVQKLQSEPVTAAIPFLFLTARVDHESRRQGMIRGADDYLTKPFAAEDLLAAVSTRLEKRAMIKQQTAQQFDELRGNLVAVLPHELRTPLNIIMGYADLILMEDASPDSDLSRMVGAIMKASQRLQHVIENYLLYAQTEIQRHDPQALKGFAKQRFETPGLMINDVAFQTAEAFERIRDISVHADDIPVHIASEPLRKMMREIVDNAFKFSKPGSSIAIVAEQQDGHYSIHVSDQGRGMTAEQIDRVGAYMQFERKLYEQQGMGLGLIVAKRLAELHGGDLTIISEPERGTTVHVRLEIAN